MDSITEHIAAALIDALLSDGRNVEPYASTWGQSWVTTVRLVRRLARGAATIGIAPETLQTVEGREALMALVAICPSRPDWSLNLSELEEPWKSGGLLAVRYFEGDAVVGAWKQAYDAGERMR